MSLAIPRENTTPYGPDAFCGSARKIGRYIRRAFEATLQAETEVDSGEDGIAWLNFWAGEIAVRVVDDLNHHYQKFHGKIPENPLVGFAVREEPRRGLAFAKSGLLPKVLNSIGHEIGHLITDRLPESVDEEGKAYSFEFAWTYAISDKNIGGIRDVRKLLVAPDQKKHPNHHRAFNFVQPCIQQGFDPMKLYWLFADGHKRVPL